MDQGRRTMLDVVKSLGMFVGKGTCNAKCKHCAGLVHRKNAPIIDGGDNCRLIQDTLVSCWEKGCRTLSISSSGEPTMSPESVTGLLREVALLNMKFMPYKRVHMYTNGIRIGNDLNFCTRYLPIWRDYGLDTIYLTVHNADEHENAKIYGVSNYPSLFKIVERVHVMGEMQLRANVVLGKRLVGTLEEYVAIVEKMHAAGADSISAWKVRNANDEIDVENAIDERELEKIKYWTEVNALNDYVCIYDENDREAYEKGEKLTLFPDGTLSSTWCK